ncbi:alpha/beta hydrolase [Actinomycetospora endophytica]|uniref:Alpha/beta hydrolase n=1 Tax=Actinomycetospora endophytica TaxID=2291215 RepID=A0ABS8PEP2_9PSEU|nr:alpha/beta hydrolase [Actinomycetospora endophytica]MCD2196733.1 alpha/beta hydrolase [Actinomycetospora endophytica]
MLVAAAVLAALGLFAGCAVGPSQRPPVATVNSDEPATEAPAEPAPEAPPPALPPLTPSNPALDFTDCTGPTLAGLGGRAALGGRDVRTGCATVPVGGGFASGSASAAEVDVTRVTIGPAPAGPTVPIAVLGDPGRRTGTEAAVRLAAQGPADLLAGRTLYGIDVRGSSGTAVDCITPTTRAALDDADPTAADPAALGPLSAAAGSAAKTCSQLLEDSVTDFSTATDADDLEAVRQALGAPRLNAIGLGGGAATLAAWAQSHTGAQGRLVLDALPDPTAVDPARSDARAAAARSALDAFATQCVAAGNCPLGPDPRGAVTDLVTRLRAAPLPASPTATGPVPGRTVTAGTLVTVLVDRLADPESWPALESALATARAGDPAGILGLAEAREGTGPDDAGYDLGLVQTCNDDPARQTVDQVGAAVRRAAAGDPVFGGWFAQRALECSSWPVPTSAPAPLAGTPTPSLLLGTASDPAVPLSESQRVAAGMQGSVLVSWLGAGHGAYPATPCISGVVDDFLVGGTIPREETVCPP